MLPVGDFAGGGTVARKQREQGWPYKDEFHCHRCGNCCRGDGYVEMTMSDIARAALLLEITEAEFLRVYTKGTPGDLVLLLDQVDEVKSCIFLTQDEKGLYGCRIHKAKPSQCEGFPFMWRPRDVTDFCDGMRALEGLPPTRRETMTRETERDAKK